MPDQTNDSQVTGDVLQPGGQTVTPDVTQPQVQAPQQTPQETSNVLIGDAPAPVPTSTIGADQVGRVYEYDHTDDPGLNMCLDFVGKLGIAPDSPEMVAANNGDFTLLKATLSSNPKAAGFENYLFLAERAFNDGKQKHEQRQQEIAQSIYAAVGGEQVWGEIKSWAAANADDAEKASINAALQKGGVEARIVAEWLASKYNGVKSKPAQAVATATQSSGSGAYSSSQMLTADQYGVEISKLHAKHGINYHTTQEYQQLQARRVASKAAGF